MADAVLPPAPPRPLVLLDVDGPLNPYAQKPHRRDELPLPYKTLRLRPRGWERTSKPLRVWLSERHGPMLCRFAVAHGADLVWATTWEHDANRMIGPEIGLPALPVIEFGQHPGTVKGWKYPAVAAYAAERPLVWFDDDFQVADHAQAMSEFLASRRGAPTLLHHVDPRRGITQDDVDEASRWLSGVGRG